MKTNKIWSVLVMLMIALCATFTFSSCGSDDGEYDPERPEVGTWVGSESGKGYDVEYEVIMKSNGSFKRTTVGVVDDEDYKFVDSGNYVVGDGVVVIKWTDGTDKAIIGETDTYKWVLSEDGQTVSIWVHGNSHAPLVLKRK